MTTEDLVRAALDRAAEMAPDERRVRAALADRARRYRQRRALLVAGGVVAAAGGAGAIGVPLVLGGGVGPSFPQAPLRYRPTWLPDGVGETSRGTTVGAGALSQFRSWGDPGRPGSDIALFLDPLADLPVPAEPDAGTVVRDLAVAGRPGQVFGTPDGNGAAHVDWLIEDDLRATVLVPAMPSATDIAVRIANSVVRDDVSSCEVGLRLGWLPPGVRANQIAVSRNRDGWTRTLQTGPPRADDRTRDATVSIRLGERREVISIPEGGARATIRGLPGLVFQNSSEHRAIVELVDGTWLEVVLFVIFDHLGRNELLHVANDLRIGAVDLGWLGSR